MKIEKFRNIFNLQFPFWHQTLTILCLLLIETWMKLAYSFLPFTGRKYGVIIIIGVIGYGYVWWKVMLNHK